MLLVEANILYFLLLGLLKAIIWECESLSLSLLIQHGLGKGRMSSYWAARVYLYGNNFYLCFAV
jgi:hypothetical protein